MKIVLKFPQKIMQDPLLADVILETGVRINIDRAFVDATIGEIVIDVPDDRVDVVAEAFRSRGTEVREMDTPLIFDEAECVQCGACVSVCPAEVFKYEDDRTISIDLNRCVLCKTCVAMCPHGALKTAEG
ncbi:MAG TPA: 4Fe-4S binding protein [Candidatus Bathyarchaeia archaeon]|nr:4Fe-4S binding protein [Candidatus Bathyarchaeia archaeon]